MTETPRLSAPLPPWTVRSSRYVHRDRWIGLRADDCVTDEGVAIAPYYVVEYPDWVQIVAIDADDHLILVEQYRHGLQATSLELPAGGMDPGDDGPLATAARELAEETGYGADDWRYIAALSPNPANHRNVSHAVLATGAAPRGVPRRDPTERLNVVRVPLEQAVRRVMAGDMLNAMHVASLAMALTVIGRWRV